MKVTLSISSNELNDLEISDFARDLLATLMETPGLDADLATAVREGGAKGDAVATGTIIMTLIGSGGVAVSLINILKAYVARGRKNKIRVKNSQGKQVDLEGTNLTASQIRKTTALLKELLGELN